MTIDFSSFYQKVVYRMKKFIYNDELRGIEDIDIHIEEMKFKIMV